MPKYSSAAEETIERMHNLILENLENGSHRPIFIDSIGDGRGVATKLIDDLPWIEFTRLEGTPLTICRLSQH